MRIGLVLENFDPARGGREQWTWRFAERLMELGHEVHVVARSCSLAARRLPITVHPVLCDPSPIAFGETVRTVLEPLALDIVHDMGMGWHCDVFHPHGGSMASSADSGVKDITVFGEGTPALISAVEVSSLSPQVLATS